MHTQGVKLITTYFPKLDNGKISQLLNLEKYYKAWNQKINVISRKDIKNIYLHHVLYSLSIACVTNFKEGTQVLDVGTGGGFPGIPLAIMFPKADFVLLDSMAKKIKVVKDISQCLGLTNVKTVHSRVENITDTYDFVIGRGVTGLENFYHWTKDRIKKNGYNDLTNGILYLRGDDERIDIAKTKHDRYPLHYFFKEPFFETKCLVHLYSVH